MKLSAFAHAFGALAAVIIGVLLGFLGVIDGAPLAGLSAFITFLLIGYALFHRAETLMVEEAIGRRLFKGSLN